ncbi:hypothetical protein, partial [Salmonella enterica]|uniref:hypothetical protein n=1 Tax=Salmonella enterica TaxID=28901 RepID=UPI001ED9489A
VTVKMQADKRSAIRQTAPAGWQLRLSGYGIDTMPVYTALFRRHNRKPSLHRCGKLSLILHQESSHDPLPKTLEYLRH